jgi:hypothetical protein
MTGECKTEIMTGKLTISGTLSATNPTRASLELNPGLCVEKLATIQPRVLWCGIPHFCNVTFKEIEQI